MKKLLAVLVAGVALVACSNNDNAASTDANASAPVAASQDASAPAASAPADASAPVASAAK